MTELKPCPFCGGKAKLEHYETDGYLPMCSVDGCFGMVEKWFEAPEEAIEAWNRRGSSVTCKDCKHVQHDEVFGRYWCNGREVTADWYCADGREEQHEHTDQRH